jgi:hypothetical protein
MVCQPCSGLSSNGYAWCCDPSLTFQLFAIYLPRIYDLFTDRNKQRPYNQVVARRKFQLSEEQVRELTSAYRYGRDGPTRPRLQAVRLYGTGYPVNEIMEITGCSRTSLMEWCRAYRDEGVDGNSAKVTLMK